MIQLQDISVQDRPELYQPPRRDVLRLPVIGRILKHRRGRLVFQVPLLLLALLLIYDGFTGPRLASQNLATVSVWVHYRGFVILALLLFGNLFCMGCPFTIPRTIALRLSRSGRRWPRVLRNKWLAVGFFVGFLFIYEWWDLWAVPAATAWLIIAYFVGAFALEVFFAESPFCKYVCPLGTFNFVASTASPTQITVRDHETCRTCPGKECVKGQPYVLGCGTELFPPTVRSNLDCILCLDCARACPYDNVALAIRTPGRELTDANAWPRRWDVSFLVMVFAFAAVSNAFGMVPPFYELQAGLAASFGIRSEAILLLLIFVTLNLALPGAAGLLAARLSQLLSGKREPMRVSFCRFAPAFIPVAFAIWLAHYGFHFATGALTLIPVMQNFLLDHGLSWLGTEPNWMLGPLVPGNWILPIQTIIVLAGFAGSLFVGRRIGERDYESPAAGIRAMLPWLVVFLGLALAALAMFNLPMEMRGTINMGG